MPVLSSFQEERIIDVGWPVVTRQDVHPSWRSHKLQHPMSKTKLVIFQIGTFLDTQAVRHSSSHTCHIRKARYAIWTFQCLQLTTLCSIGGGICEPLRSFSRWPKFLIRFTITSDHKNLHTNQCSQQANWFLPSRAIQWILIHTIF